jgi:hypothetical protein
VLDATTAELLPPQAASSKPLQEDVYDALYVGLGSSDCKVAQRAIDILMPSYGSGSTSLGFNMPAEEALALLHTAVEQYHTLDTHRELLLVLRCYVPIVRQLAPTQLLPVVQRAIELDSCSLSADAAQRDQAVWVTQDFGHPCGS